MGMIADLQSESISGSLQFLSIFRWVKCALKNYLNLIYEMLVERQTSLHYFMAFLCSFIIYRYDENLKVCACIKLIIQ